MTAAERLRGPRLKMERANAHVRDLHTEIRAFLDSKPYTARTKRNPDTRQLDYYLARCASPPFVISLLIGDALFNLRSALDHLAVQFLLAGNPQAPTFDVYFPIYGSDTEYARKAPGRMKGMPQKAIDFINAAKPYKGGNDDLWRLNKLNNIDKHRLLITAIGKLDSFNVGPSMIAMARKVRMDLPDIDLFLRVGQNGVALKEGDVIFTDAPDAEPNPKIEFRVQIAINEPGVAEMETLPDLLDQLGRTVVGILNASEPILA